MTYQIKNWGAFYENDRSRATKNCRWCAVPNKQDGLGYSRLVGLPNGPALYGCFVAIVLMASKQEERGGWLTRDGSPPTHGGVPLTPGDIALMVRMPEEIVAATLDACCSDGVAWIDATPNSRQTHVTVPPDSRQTPSEGKEGNGKEGTEKKERGVGGGTLKAAKFDPRSLPLPDVFFCTEFTGCWADWIEHRKEIKKPLTQKSAEAQLSKLIEMGLARAVAAIRNSIAGGYQGIFEPNENRRTSGNHSNGRPQTEAERRRSAVGQHGDAPDPSYDPDAPVPY